MSQAAALMQIEMLEKRFGFFPKSFRIGGHTYAVAQVDRCWTQPGRSPRHYFKIRCAEGDFVLCQDVNANTWSIERGNAGT